MPNLFFQILQLAVGSRSGLSYAPTAKEWATALGDAKKQALVGVCFYGLQRANRQNADKLAGLPAMLKAQWLAMAVSIERRNELMNRRCAELHDMLQSAGYPSCVLKGQAVAMRYGIDGEAGETTRLSSLRQSGDIDMWMIADADAVLQWARSTDTMYYFDYHHADLRLFADAEIELHYRPSISRNLWRNHRLQQWFKGEGRRHVIYNKELHFTVPDDEFSLVLTLNHNLWHLLYEGVGLRQMMDLYFVARTMHPTAETSRLLRHFQLEKFAAASAWVLWHLFDGGRSDSAFLSNHSPLPAPDERTGRFLLDEIMQAGNFGHYDNRLKANRYTSRIGLMAQWLRHTWRLVRYFPAEVAWTPLGILRISLWRRWKSRA